MEKIYYEKKKVFEEKIQPLLFQLKTICNAEKMPMFISVAVENSPSGTLYANDAVLASTGVRLEDNRIADIMLSMNGLVTDYPDYIKKDLRELEEFIQRSKERTDSLKESPLGYIDDAELTEDQFPAFQKIILGGQKAVLPDTMKGIPLAEKYWED